MQPAMFLAAKSNAEITADKLIFTTKVLPLLSQAGWHVMETDLNVIQDRLQPTGGVMAWLSSSFPQTIGAWTLTRERTEWYFILYYEKKSVKFALADPKTMSSTTFKDLKNAALWNTEQRPVDNYNIYARTITEKLPTSTPATPPPPLR
jgi:hypothetical protein